MPRSWDAYHDEAEADALATFQHTIEELVREYDYMDEATVKVLDDGERATITGKYTAEYSYELDDDSEWNYLCESVPADHADGDSDGIFFAFHPKAEVNLADCYDERMGLTWDDRAVNQRIADKLVDAVQPRLIEIANFMADIEVGLDHIRHPKEED